MSKRIIFFIFIAFLAFLKLSCGTDSHEQITDGLFLAIDSNKMGYIDNKGKWVIELPQEITSAGLAFSEGFAPIKIDEQFGFINVQGNIVIPPKFDQVGDFIDGRALVLVKGKFGYIDSTGEMITPKKFDKAFGFSEGLGKVQIGNVYGFIDRNGNMVIEPRFEKTGVFSEGVVNAQIGEKWGYVDKNGKVIIQPQFDAAWPFSEGLAVVEIQKAYGYVNKSGKVIIDPISTRYAGRFSGGLARVDIEGDCFINPLGDVVLRPKFNRAGDFSEGFAKVATEEVLQVDTDKPYRPGVLNLKRSSKQKWGIIDKDGDIIVEPQYDSIEDFSNGLAQFRKGQTWGYINRKGKVVWESSY